MVIAAVIIFPLFWEVDVIRFSIVTAEIMAIMVIILFLKIHKKNINIDLILTIRMIKDKDQHSYKYLGHLPHGGCPKYDFMI